MSYYPNSGGCTPCCSPCDAPPASRHLRFQQIASWAAWFGFSGFQATDVYASAAGVARPTGNGLVYPLHDPGAADYPFAMEQPTPTTRTMLFPYGTAPWNAYPTCRDVYAYHLDGWEAHTPQSTHYFPSNRSAGLSYPWSNGLAAAEPAVGDVSVSLDGFYWVNDQSAAESDTLRIWAGWASYDRDGYGRLSPPVATADACTVELSVPVTAQEWWEELDNRLHAIEFPLPEGHSHNHIYERDEAGAMIHALDVFSTCGWCVAENQDAITAEFFSGQAGGALCPPGWIWQRANYNSCRKAPPGPWWEPTCDEQVRFFAFYYEDFIEVEKTDPLEIGDTGGQPSGRRAISATKALLPARWKGRIRVSGLAPGEPVLLRKYPYGGQGYTEETRHAPDGEGEQYLDIEPPTTPGFIRVYPMEVP